MTTISPSSFNSSSDLEKEECPYIYDAVWQKSYLTENTYRNLVAITCIRAITLFPTIVLNALVIFVVATRRRLQTNTNILLASLAGTDLLTGLIVQPISIAVEIKRILDDGPFCSLETTFGLLIAQLAFLSLSNLALLSVDRYIAVKYSLRYPGTVTKHRLMASVLLVWALTLVLTVQEIPFTVVDLSESLYQIFKDAIFAVMLLGFIAVIIYTNYYIFSETQRQKRRIQTEQVTYEEAKRMKKDKKAANTLAVILAALTLTYLVPIIIGFSMIALANTVNSHSLIKSWCSTFVLLGSLFNPVIYCWRIKKLRRAFLEILHFREQENRPQVLEMTNRTNTMPSTD